MKRMFSFPLYVQGLKRIRAAGFAVVVCLMAIAVMNIADTNFNTLWLGGECKYCVKDFSHFTSFTSPYMIVLVVIVPFFTYSMFSYLNSRKGSDFYHSLPQKRSAVFVSQGAAVLTWLIGAVALTATVTALYWLYMGAPLHFYMWANTILCFGALILYFFACTALGMMLTGTVLSACFAAIVIAWLPPFVMYCFEDALNVVFPRMVSEKTVLELIGYEQFLPKRLFFETFERGDFSLNLALLVSVLYSLALAALACLAYTKRKSETASHPTANAVTQHIMRGAAALPVVIIAANSAFWVGNSGVSVSPKALTVAFVIYLVYELISSRSLKSALKAAPWFLTVITAGGLLIGSVYLTASVMHSNDPTDAAQIKSVTLYGSFDVGGTTVSNYDGVVIEDDEIFRLLAESYDYGDDSYNHIKISYKNGKTVYRRLRLNRPMADAIATYVMADTERSKIVHPLPKWEDIVQSDSSPQLNKAFWETFEKEYYKLGEDDRYMVSAQIMTVVRDYTHESFKVEFINRYGNKDYAYYHADPVRTKQTYKLLTEGA